MKVILCMLLLFLSSKITAQRHVTLKEKAQKLSQVFRSNSLKYDTLITFHIAAVFRTNEEPYKVIAVKNGEWDVIEYFPAIFSVRNDSNSKRKCTNCSLIFAEITENNLISLPDEQTLRSPCQQLTDIVIDGQKMVRINDFNLREDEPVYRIEYKIGKKRRIVSYKSPSEALKICPDSKERIAFVNIVNAISRAM